MVRSGSLNIPGNNLYGGLSEFTGGVQAGYNFQAGHFLLGVEGEFDGAGFAHPVLPAPTLGLVDQRWIGTAAGRIGLVNDRWLVFAKFGGGWVHSNVIFESSRHSLERVEHQQRLVGWCWYRIRLQVALDGQTRIRLSRAIKLEFSYPPCGGFEPRPSNGQSRDQLQIPERPSRYG